MKNEKCRMSGVPAKSVDGWVWEGEALPKTLSPAISVSEVAG
jgi:hypothetical protein